MEMEGVTCCALIDTRAGASYGSSTLINNINKKNHFEPEQMKSKLSWAQVQEKLRYIPLKFRESIESLALKRNLDHLKKRGVVGISRPKMPRTTNYCTYVHLKNLHINDHDPKSKLPAHEILGISDYTKIKTQERPRVGVPEEPIAELSKFGCVIVSPRKETGFTNLLFSKTSLHDYEKCFSLNCLSIEERRDDCNYVYEEFEKQLGRAPGRLYQRNLFWKDNHAPLKNKKSKKFEKQQIVTTLTYRNQLQRYDNIIQD